MISKALHRRDILRVATMGALALIANSATCAVTPEPTPTRTVETKTTPEDALSVANTPLQNSNKTPITNVPTIPLEEEHEEEEEEEEAFEDEWGVASFAPSERILIGCASSTSQFGSQLTASSGHKLHHIGTDIQNAAQIALKDRPLIKGFHVDLLPMDSRCSIDGGISVANHLANNKRVVGVIGHMCSSSSISASPIYANNHIPMISPSSTSVSLTSTKTASVNRTIWNEKDQASYAAKFLLQTLRVSRVLIISDKSSYGKDIAATFESTFSRAGGLVVATVQASTLTDISRVIDSIGSLAPDALYFGGSLSSGTRVLSTLRKRHPTHPLFMGTDTIGTTSFIDSSLGLAEDTMCTKFRMNYPTGPKYDNFKRSYLHQFDIDPSTLGPFHTHSYDATMIMLEGIHQASRIGVDGSLIVDKKALVDAIRSTRNYDGLSGNISFDSHGDGGSAELDVYIVKDGSWVPHKLAAEPAT